MNASCPAGMIDTNFHWCFCCAAAGLAGAKAASARANIEARRMKRVMAKGPLPGATAAADAPRILFRHRRRRAGGCHGPEFSVEPAIRR
ncbi:hypothetical protein STHU_55340 [Allostella humosa]|nr:hypothetical protein STHU_55340 [Stella humosa]